jgi:hypothetical protein
MYTVTMTAGPNSSVSVQDPSGLDLRISVTLRPNQVKTIAVTDDSFDRLKPYLEGLVTQSLLASFTYHDGAASEMVNDSAVAGATIAEALDTLALGISGGTTFAWLYKTPTGDADPGAGNFRLNHADPTLATFIYISVESTQGVDVSSVLEELRAGVTLAIDSKASIGAMWVFECSGTSTDATPYFKIPVTFKDAGPVPIVADDNCDITFISSFAHALGGDLHKASTIAQFNNKLTDGDVDKTTDLRDPKAHAASHNGGSDPVTPGGIGAEPAFSKNPAFNKSFGAGAADVCEGNDGRLSNARTPIAHAASHNGGSDPVTPAGIGAEPSFSKNPAFNKAFGVGATDVCVGNDARLSDARTPTQHALDSASLHAALSDIVTYNVSAAVHGFLPKFPDIIGQIFRGDGTWGVLKQFLDMQDPTGIVNRTQSTIAFVDISRTFTITPVGSTFEYYIKGTEYSKTNSPPNSIIIDDVEGLHFIYYDGATLSKTTTFDFSLILEKALLAIVYWDATNKTAILLGDERHGISMPGMTHLAKHLTAGTLLEGNGLALSGMDVDGSGGDNSAAQFGYEGGAIWDEDLRFAISADTTPAQIPVFYKTGAGGLWRKYVATDYPVRSYAGLGTNLLAFNEFTGGVWTQTEVGNNDYVLTHIFATNDPNIPVIVIQGEAQYATIGAARDGAQVEMLAITTVGLPIAEFQPLASVVYQCSSVFSNAVQAIVRSTGDGANYVDWRHVSGGSTGGLAAPSTDYLVRAANDFVSFGNKATPAAGDRVLVEDSADSYGKKYVNASVFGGGGGGQTNTVVGATGITNTGDNADAVLAPTYGSAPSTICQGNDARLTDARTPLSHAASHNGGLDPVTPAGIGAEPAFSKNTGFNKNFGTGAGDVCQGNDGRLADARTPVAHAGSHNGGSDPVTAAGVGAEPAFSKNNAFNKTFGTGAGTVCQGNDSRIGAPPTILQGSEDAEDSSTDTDYWQAYRYAPTLEASTKYIVWYDSEYTGDSTTSWARARLQINDTVTVAELAHEIESLSNDEWWKMSGVYFLTTTTAGTYNFDFDIQTEDGADTVYIRRKRIVLMKVVE